MERKPRKYKSIRFNAGRFQKGNKLSEKHIEKLRSISGEKHHSWKGDKAGYFGIHLWLTRHFPAPEKCEFCQEKKKLQLANITGLYNREFHNYKYLCSKCHMSYDDQHNKAWKTRKSVDDVSTGVKEL